MIYEKVLKFLAEVQRYNHNREEYYPYSSILGMCIEQLWINNAGKIEWRYFSLTGNYLYTIGGGGGGTGSPDGNTGVTDGSSNGTISGIDSNDPDVINNVKTNFNTTLQEMMKAAEFFPKMKKVVDSFSKIFGNYEIYMMSDEDSHLVLKSEKFTSSSDESLDVVKIFYEKNYDEYGNLLPKSGFGHIPLDQYSQRNGIIILRMSLFSDTPENTNFIWTMNAVLDEFNHARMNIEGSLIRGMEADKILYNNLIRDYNQISNEALKKQYFQFHDNNKSLYRANGGK